MARNRLQLDERAVFSAGNVEIFEFSPLEENPFINNLGVAFIEISNDISTDDNLVIAITGCIPNIFSCKSRSLSRIFVPVTTHAGLIRYEV